MSRRIALALFAAFAFAAPAHAQPNVVLIVTDDQRWDTLGYMPTVQAELVDKGVTFENAFVVNPICCPSRASILTGDWSHTTGVWTLELPWGGFRAFRDAESLPVWLDQAGYETALVGKYLNGYGSPAYVPPGWDRWFALWGAQAYYGYRVSDQGAERTFGSDPASYSTDVLAAEAVDFIEESGPGPFFLYFSPIAPHIYNPGGAFGPLFDVPPAPRHAGQLAGLPYVPAPSVNEANVADKPAWVRQLEPVAQTNLDALRRGQLESLLAVDEAVAAVVAALEEKGELADTLIVFTSDNGYGWGEHRWVTKMAAYEESIRVPLVIRHDTAGRIGPEVRMALNVDIAPTILETAGLPARGEGRSLFTGPERSSVLIERVAGSEAKAPAYAVPTYCAVRTGRWKYVQYETDEEELYDLRADPFELHNLAGRLDLRRALVGWRARILDECQPAPPGLAPLSRCLVQGTAGPDRLRGTHRFDLICGGGGRDVIRAGRGGDVIYAGLGRDLVRAGRGNDRVHARFGGRDRIDCGPGLDSAFVDKRDRVRGCERAFRP